MKTTMKIAVIFMMGMSLGVSAQNIFPNEGDVGIGTTSPSSELEIKSKSNNNAEIHINSSTDGKPSIIRFQDAGLNTWGFLSNYPQIDKFSLYNYHNGSNSIVIDKESNVGIGTTSPRQKLELYNSKAFNNQMEFQSQDHLLLSSSYKNNGEFFGGITWESGGRRRASIVATREHNDADHVGMAFFTKGTDGPGSFFESMRISHRGNIGIGTTSPDEKLDVNGNAVFRGDIGLLKYGNAGMRLKTTANHKGTFISGFYNSTSAEWYLGSIVSGIGGTQRGMLSYVHGNNPYQVYTSNQKRFEISGNGNAAIYGKLEAKEIKVTTSPTADFVFEESYNLPTLKSIEKHIKEKKHLPEIASAKEMEKNGVNVGNFQIQLLQKIEELTLYTIEQEKKIKSLEKQKLKIETQEKKIERLESLVLKLLKNKN